MSENGVRYTNSPNNKKLAPDGPFKILLPVSYLEEAKVMLPLAEMLVQGRRGQLLLLHILPVLEDQVSHNAVDVASHFREDLVDMLNDEVRITAQIKTIARSPDQTWDGIWETVAQEQANMVLLAWSTDDLPETAVGAIQGDRLAAPPCDVVAVRPIGSLTEQDYWMKLNKLLLPVRGGPNSGLTLRIGHAIAQRNNGVITLLHVSSEISRTDQNKFLDEFAPAMRNLERITRAVTTKGQVSQMINKEAQSNNLIVMGAPSQDIRPDGWSGPMLDAVSEGDRISLIVVKERRQTRPGSGNNGAPGLTQVDRPVAVLVDQWFVENTYHSREFADLSRLMALKEQQQVTISLGLPALNEEETVGKVIRTVKNALMDDFPLLDEIVLIDSGSVDYTREIASDLGIPVYTHQEILPNYGAYTGKGEGLWKSLYILKGDIIAWIDTDIKNIHPRFVYGVIGPLLRDSNIQYVKGFYRRPLIEGERLVAGGGGRVTELTARPFINLFYPELSGIIQPLSGEYAGRRASLERMPFFTGYGVETGLLLDLLDEFGLNAIAQVDLLERIHHNQPLPSLSQMSFAIMQVVFSRLERRHMIDLLEEANLTMNLIRYGPKRHYYLEAVEIREHERPPMITIPEYCRRRGMDPGKAIAEEQAGEAKHPANQGVP